MHRGVYSHLDGLYTPTNETCQDHVIYEHQFDSGRWTYLGYFWGNWLIRPSKCSSGYYNMGPGTEVPYDVEWPELITVTCIGEFNTCPSVYVCQYCCLPVCLSTTLILASLSPWSPILALTKRGSTFSSTPSLSSPSPFIYHSLSSSLERDIGLRKT